MPVPIIALNDTYSFEQGYKFVRRKLEQSGHYMESWGYLMHPPFPRDDFDRGAVKAMQEYLGTNPTPNTILLRSLDE